MKASVNQEIPQSEQMSVFLTGRPREDYHIWHDLLNCQSFRAELSFASLERESQDRLQSLISQQTIHIQNPTAQTKIYGFQQNDRGSIQ